MRDYSLGYGDLDFVTHGGSVWNDLGKVDANTSLFSETIETEIIPAVERDYDTAGQSTGTAHHGNRR